MRCLVQGAGCLAQGAGCLVLGAVVLLPSAAGAQTTDAGRLEISGGVQWAGRTTMGTADATETAPDGSRFRLFASDESLTPAAGVEGRVGFRLLPKLQVEGAVSFSKPQLEARLRSDIEGISD